MHRFIISLIFLFTFIHFPGYARDDKGDPVDRALMLNQAMVTAERELRNGSPAIAVQILEAKLSESDGKKAFLDLLRQAYLGEIEALKATVKSDPDRPGSA